MRIGILGSGAVGRTLGTAFIERGHDVLIGSRTDGTDATKEWVATTGERASVGTFGSAAAFGEVLVNATGGSNSLAAFAAADPADVAGKVLLDVSNPLDFSAGFPPSLSVPSTDSVAERLQHSHPMARVVKALNTVTNSVMVQPSLVAGHHTLPIAGDDAAAKAVVRGLLGELGWGETTILDLGGLDAARGMEAYVLFWVRLMQATGTPVLNIEVRTG
jgi:predicted dinucleotide-binding enzyme